MMSRGRRKCARPSVGSPVTGYYSIRIRKSNGILIWRVAAADTPEAAAVRALGDITRPEDVVQYTVVEAVADTILPDVKDAE